MRTRAFGIVARLRIIPLTLMATCIGCGEAPAQWPNWDGTARLVRSHRHAPRPPPLSPPIPMPVPRHQARRPALPMRPDPYLGWRSVEPRKWPHIAWPPPARALTPKAAPEPAQPVQQDSIAACVVKLAGMGIDAAPAALRKPASVNGVACFIPVPVHLIAIRMAAGKPVTIAGEPEVDCSMAERFGVFVREIVAPLAVGHLGTPLTTISAGGFYCRPVDSIPGEKLSPHGIGIAVDVSGFVFADGRRFDIGQAGPAESAAFFKAVRTAACGYFTTVLGPGQPFHDTHLHVDFMVHGSSDRYRICQ